MTGIRSMKGMGVLAALGALIGLSHRGAFSEPYQAEATNKRSRNNWGQRRIAFNLRTKHNRHRNRIGSASRVFNMKRANA